MGSFNIIDIIICAVLALSLVSGMHKGFMGSILALGGFIGSWFAALQVYKRLADAVTNIGPVMDFIGSVASPLENLFSNAPGLAGTAITQWNEKISAVGEMTFLQQALGEIRDLRIINTMFENNVKGGVFDGLSTIGQYLTQTVAEALINVLSFVVAFAVIYFAVLLLVNLLNNVFRFPSLKHLDWFLGGVLGAFRGAFIVLLIFAVMPTVLSIMENMNIPQLGEMINNSSLAGMFRWDWLSNFIGNLLG